MREEESRGGGQEKGKAEPGERTNVPGQIVLESVVPAS